MKKSCMLMFAAAVAASLDAATINQVIVRQQWPWSTKVKVEYSLSGVDASHPVDITVNPRELARIMIRTGSEPNPKRTAELKSLSVLQPGGKYGRLLEKSVWSMDRDSTPERFTVGDLKCVICHNLGQTREVLESAEAFDVIRVIG